MTTQPMIKLADGNIMLQLGLAGAGSGYLC